MKAIIFDGKEHPVDSKEIAFQTAGRECFKKAMMGAGPQLLEPIYEVSVTVPADNMGDIMGDMNTRRHCRDIRSMLPPECESIFRLLPLVKSP